MKLTTQDEVDEILAEFSQASQALKESIFDIVLNSQGALDIRTVNEMDINDVIMFKKQLKELLEAQSKQQGKFLQQWFKR